MKEDFTSTNKDFFFLAFFIIAIIAFFPLFTTGFATADDFLYYLSTRRGLNLADLARGANFSGRFHLYIVGPFYFLPYIFDNMVAIKIFHFVPLLLCFILFAKIVLVITKSKAMAWLTILIFLLTMQISKHTSLFVAYPFYFTFSFCLLLTSFYLLLRFYENRQNSTLIFSALSFGGGLLFYETYIFFLLFAMIAIIANNINDQAGIFKKIKNSVIQFIPFLAIALSFLAAYIIFRIYHPSQYGGSNIAAKGTSIFSFLMVLWRLAYSSFPLTVYETSRTLFQDKSELINGYSPVVLRLILSARVEWIVKGVFVAFCGYHLLVKAPWINVKALLKYSGMAMLLIFVPHIPLALTEKYTFYVEKSGMIGYVTTFFSFFGTVLLIILFLSFLVNLLNFNTILKKVLIGFFICGFFICSILTDFSNYSIAKDIRSANLRFYVLDELCKTDEFKSIPPNSPFYGKTLWDNPSYSAASITEQGFNWQEYFAVRSGINLPVERDDKTFLYNFRNGFPAPCFLTLRQTEKSDDVLLVMAKIAPIGQRDSVVNHFADRALVVYYSSYKYFTVTFQTNKDNIGNKSLPIKINHIVDEIPAGETVQITIYNTKKGNKATCFSVEFPGIDLNSIIISNMVNRGNKIFYL